MELYSIYESLFTAMAYVKGNAFFTVPSLVTTFIIAVGVVLGLFLLQGFGIYAMAKKQKLEKCYLAFIPFANTFYLGKIAGKSSFFGKEMKGASVYAMIAQIVSFVGGILIILAKGYLLTQCGEITYDPSTAMPIVPELSGSAIGVFRAYEIGGYVLSMINLVYQILLFIVIISLYKKYTVKNYSVLSLLQLFVPISRYIVIFVLRNNEPIDYDEYMRKKREAYMRTQGYNPYGQYGQNPYGHNPYGQNPYGPYGQNPYNQGQGQKAPDDPFGEFSSNGTGGANGQNGTGAAENGGGTDDGFFS